MQRNRGLVSSQVGSWVGSSPIQREKTFVATGGAIVDSAGYRYHTFTASGIFTVQSGKTVADILLVGGGGGGGGGGGIGSGGGGGAIMFLPTQELVSRQYSVVVGAGGVSIADGESAGGPGTKSQFDNFEIVFANQGKASLGGAAGNGGDSRRIVAGVENTQTGGSNGGSGAPNRAGGGGASASANGGSATAAVAGGVGANGTEAYSIWALATGTGQLGRYGGGGGGGFEFSGTASRAPAGLGGGGAGGAGTTSPLFNAENGLVNTGGGGGGCGGRTGVIGGLSGNGGSGIVIIRYYL